MIHPLYSGGSEIFRRMLSSPKDVKRRFSVTDTIAPGDMSREVNGGGRERQREMQWVRKIVRQRETERDRKRKGERERQRDIEREKERETDRER